MPEYIEREALLEEARKRAKAFSSVLIYEAIKQAPTADVVEVKYGEWIDKKFFGVNIMVCSICECMCEVARFENFGYCPKCGAKMDLKGSKEDV